MNSFIIKNKRFVGPAILVVAALLVYYYLAIYNSYHFVEIYASYKSYQSVNEMYNDADLVVLAKPAKNFIDRDHHSNYYNLSKTAIGGFYTNTEINIEKILKDPSEVPKTLTIIEPVTLIQGLNGKTELSYENYKPMKKNSPYVIFMRKNTFGNYSVINMQNGKFNMDKTDPGDDQTGNKQSDDQKLSWKNEIKNKFGIK